MIPQHSIRQGAAPSPSKGPSARLHTTKRSALGRSHRGPARSVRLFGLASSMLVAPTEASAAPFGPGPFAPGASSSPRVARSPGTAVGRDRRRGLWGV